MRLLFVEDEEKVRNFVTRGLKSAGFAVDEAADGSSGLELSEHYNYDLIILDIMLPQLSGTEVLKRIRAKGNDVPVLVLTALDSITEKVKHFESGADDYLSKPFAFAELEVRVKSLLKRSNSVTASFLKIGDLEINRTTHQVRKAGKRIDLSAKEYSLLEYLALNAGRVLSRTMIIEHVWDQSFEGLTNIVDVYIRQLRSKIDDNSQHKIIHTLRGVGYSISDGQE
jgi:two-component system copper resistance phosphate regulon response regulator CusR